MLIDEERRQRRNSIVNDVMPTVIGFVLLPAIILTIFSFIGC